LDDKEDNQACNYMCTYPQRLFVWNRWEEKPSGNRKTQVHLEKSEDDDAGD